MNPFIERYLLVHSRGVTPEGEPVLEIRYSHQPEGSAEDPVRQCAILPQLREWVAQARRGLVEALQIGDAETFRDIYSGLGDTLAGVVLPPRIEKALQEDLVGAKDSGRRVRLWVDD